MYFHSKTFHPQIYIFPKVKAISKLTITSTMTIWLSKICLKFNLCKNVTPAYTFLFFIFTKYFFNSITIIVSSSVYHAHGYNNQLCFCCSLFQSRVNLVIRHSFSLSVFQFSVQYRLYTIEFTLLRSYISNQFYEYWNEANWK